MENLEYFQVALSILSTLGSVAVYRYNVAQSLKARAEMIEKFEIALNNQNRHAACELFRMLHALQKTGGIVTHSNGHLRYTRLFEKRWVRTLNKFMMKGMAAIIGSVTLSLIILSTTVHGPLSLVVPIFVIPCAAFLIMQLKDIKHDKMIDELVQEDIEYTK